MELVWAQKRPQAHRQTECSTGHATGGRFQIDQEAQKFGADAAVSRNGSTPASITITNYERIDKFNPDASGVVCDESSAIKAF